MDTTGELMLSIGVMVLGGLCCLAFMAILGGLAFWLLRRNKGDDAEASTKALDAMSSMADTARSAGEEAVSVAQQVAAPVPSVPVSSVPVPSVPVPSVPVPSVPAEHEDPAHEDPAHEDPAHEDPAHEDPAHEDPAQDEDSDMRLIRRSGEASLMEDPSDDTRLWIWKPTDGGAQKPANQWVDHWGPVPPGDVEVFCDHWCDQQDAEGLNTDRLDEVLAGLGYPDVGSWHRVYWTAVKHFGRAPVPGADLCDYDSSDLMLKHMMPARMRQQARKAQANVASDSSLLAPVEGVTVESYAACAAAAAQGMAQDEFSALLAEHGMDAVKWERVNAEWSDRMSKDATMTIVQIYGKAFQSAGRGQFGAAGASVAASQGTGAAAGGEEPVPFERLCEIQGAMAVWSTSGQDVNAMLKEVFGLTAMDWSNMNSWWMSKMSTDWDLMQTYDEKSKEYEAQYMEAAGISGEDPDADIQF